MKHKMKLTFGRYNPTEIILPESVGKSLKIEVDYLSALCKNNYADGDNLKDAASRLTFILGQMDIMDAVEIITYDEHSAMVDWVYRIFNNHGGTEYSFKEDC